MRTLAVCLCALALGGTQSAAQHDCSSLRISQLTIEYMNASGSGSAPPVAMVDMPQPRFSWRLETADAPRARIAEAVSRALDAVATLRDARALDALVRRATRERA